MPVVVDSNMVIALAVADPRAPTVADLLRNWAEAGEDLHAPYLFHYEVANGLTRSISAGIITPEQLDEAWRIAVEIPITYHPLEEGPQTVRLALQLGRQSAYDAAYIALAARLGAELWTLDGPLYRNAVGLGLSVHLAT